MFKVGEYILLTLLLITSVSGFGEDRFLIVQTPTGGSTSGNPFDQWGNTTSNVTYDSLVLTNDFTANGDIIPNTSCAPLGYCTNSLGTSDNRFAEVWTTNISGNKINTQYADFTGLMRISSIGPIDPFFNTISFTGVDTITGGNADLGASYSTFNDIYADGVLSDGTNSAYITDIILGTTPSEPFNPFDQWLNTTDNVVFNQAIIGTIATGAIRLENGNATIAYNFTKAGENYVAVGSNIRHWYQDECVTVGRYIDCYAPKGTGVGVGSDADPLIINGTGALAIGGTGTQANADNTVAIGYGSKANADNCIVIGAGASCDLPGEIKIGNETFGGEPLLKVSNADGILEVENYRARNVSESGWIMSNSTGHFYVNATAPVGTSDNPFDQWVNTTDNVTFNSLVIEDYGGSNPGLSGVIQQDGFYDSNFGSLMVFSPELRGANWVAFRVAPLLNITGAMQLFRFSPTYTSDSDQRGTMLLFEPPAKKANYKDEYRIYQEAGVNRQFFQFAPPGDASTVDYDWFTIGSSVMLADSAQPNVNYTENMITLVGGAQRIFGTNGFIHQTGLTFIGFGSQTNLESGDYVKALDADGGDFFFNGNSYIEHNGTMNQSDGSSIINIPHAEVWNVTENGYTITISTLNTWYNFTGLNADETLDFTIDGGIIPNYDGDYKIDWSVSFSGSGGSTHAISMLINGEEHTPCKSYRKLGTSGDVGNVGGTCIFPANAGDNITGAVMDINSPAQNIDVWSMNANIIRLSN